jgi:outer membrane immunogenic protein
MKQLSSIAIVSCAASLFCANILAGTESVRDGKDSRDGKEMKEVAPMPAATPSCDWSGFYLGMHAGGQFGHSATHDFATGRVFGYDESGFNGGLQLGYNFQWKWLVLGPEIDVGYMNVEGRGAEPHFPDVHGETDSDFYTTLRGRVGVQLNCSHSGCWLVYATGGAIGVNYTNRYHIDPDFFDARGNDFNWGYCVGGGVEKKLTPHWSVKAEYLYFALDDQSFGEPIGGVPVDFRAETRGHIIRAGLNYRF